MALGLLQYLVGQKYLKHVGNFTGDSEDEEEKAAMKRPLTKVEKDRVVVLFISFLLVIVFWGAFEQANERFCFGFKLLSPYSIALEHIYAKEYMRFIQICALHAHTN